MSTDREALAALVSAAVPIGNVIYNQRQRAPTIQNCQAWVDAMNSLLDPLDEAVRAARAALRASPPASATVVETGKTTSFQVAGRDGLRAGEPGANASKGVTAGETAPSFSPPAPDRDEGHADAVEEVASGPCPFDVRLARTPYLVLPKLAIQAMPLGWRRHLDALLREADDARLETPSYVVLRDDPEYSRSVPEDEEDPYGPLDRVDVFRPDPWANYRHGSIQELSPDFNPPPPPAPDRDGGRADAGGAGLEEPLEEIGRTERGYTIYRQRSTAHGGYRYWSDSIGGGGIVWDEGLASPEEMEFCIRHHRQQTGCAETALAAAQREKDEAVAAEREACAKLAEAEWEKPFWNLGSGKVNQVGACIAASIRARSVVQAADAGREGRDA